MSLKQSRPGKPGTDRPVITLVLTASLAPQAVPVLVRSDPSQRLRDYVVALNWWTRQAGLFHRILWLENSGHPLVQVISDTFRARAEVHSRPGEEYDWSRGKGYGEALLLEWAAALLADYDGYVVKCTGRLYVRNIRKLLVALSRRPDVVLRISRNLRTADSRIFAVQNKHLGALVTGLKHEIDDSRGAYLEHVLARRALQLASSGLDLAWWPRAPFVVGRSASTGQKYDTIAKYMLWPARVLVEKIGGLSPFLS